MKSSSQKGFKNGDLPAGCQDNNTWHCDFIPTYLWWVATQPDPWNVDDEKALEALQAIWDKIYGVKIPYVITLNDAVFSIVSEQKKNFFLLLFLQAQQQASNTWCNAVGSAGLTIVNAFFDSDDEFDTNEAQQAFATYMIEDSRCLYGVTKSQVSYIYNYNSLNSDLHFSPSKVSSMGIS
jgi:hypothetical protein